MVYEVSAPLRIKNASCYSVQPVYKNPVSPGDKALHILTPSHVNTLWKKHGSTLNETKQHIFTWCLTLMYHNLFIFARLGKGIYAIDAESRSKPVVVRHVQVRLLLCRYPYCLLCSFMTAHLTMSLAMNHLETFLKPF